MSQSDHLIFPFCSSSIIVGIHGVRINTILDFKVCERRKPKTAKNKKQKTKNDRRLFFGWFFFLSLSLSSSVVENQNTFTMSSGSETDEVDFPGTGRRFEQLYAGYVPKQPNEKVEILPSLPSPKTFFRDYVAKRKPCVIDTSLDEPEWCGNKWTNDYLIENAGNETLQVEKKGEEGRSFGLKAPKVKMQFSEFVNELKSGNTNLYLTTQTIEIDEEMGLPTKLFGPPLNGLAQDFALVPKLLGNLVPNNLNLWMGNSLDGSCSGLHHDFHDNLYIVIRGKKSFELYSPKDAVFLQSHGTLAKVHPNGLINYQGTENWTRGDGVPFRWVIDELKEKAEQDLAHAEEELELACEKGDQDELEKTKENLSTAEKLMDEIMDFEVSQQGEEDFGDDDDEGCCDSEEEEEEGHHSTVSAENSPPTKRRKVETKEGEGNSSSSSSSSSQKEGEEETPPDHFSKIDLTQDREEILKTFPDFSKATSMTCEVKSGQMLYLPASWFHCVTSFNLPNEKESGHIAFNYWFHPPDNPSYEMPYQDKFWPQIFKEFKKKM